MTTRWRPSFERGWACASTKGGSTVHEDEPVGRPPWKGDESVVHSNYKRKGRECNKSNGSRNNTGFRFVSVLFVSISFLSTFFYVV